MDKIAFLFAGQGSQYPGMGNDIYENNKTAKEIFERIEQIRPGTKSQCFTGTKEELRQTINTQPCLFAVDLAIAEALRAEGIRPSAVAGFSLGEIPALTFAGVFTVEDGFKLVCKRGEFMDMAANNSNSSMAAIMKLSAEAVIGMTQKYENVFQANLNSEEQTVVAGEKEELKDFCEEVKAEGGRVFPLAVSGGFHSKYMIPAAEALKQEIKSYECQAPSLPVYANYNAKPYGAHFGELSEEQIKDLIAKQIESPVFWQLTIENMIKDGIKIFIEVGPGKTLSGLVQKIAPNVNVFNVENIEDLKNITENYKLHKFAEVK